MKGSAKIELRDAKSGRLVKQIEKHNIVTNGALNAMKMNQASEEELVENYEYSLLESYFGGILLFGASIDEDVNNTIPSAAVRASYIGHASCFYTITGDSLMGTYVERESSIGTHNATLVFSFDTSQANGNINCICLTSAKGGTFGYGVTALTSKDAQNIATSFKVFNSIKRFGYDEDALVAFKDEKSYRYFTDKSMDVSDFSVAKNLGLNLSIKADDARAYYAYSMAEKPTRTPVSYSDSIGDYATVWSLDTDRVVLNVKDKSDVNTNKNMVEFEVIEAGETTSSTIFLDYTNMVVDLKQKTGEDWVRPFFDQYLDNWGLFKDYALELMTFDDTWYLCIANISKGTDAVKLIEARALVQTTGYDTYKLTNILGTIYLECKYKEDQNIRLYYRINLDTAEVANIPEFSSQDISNLKIHTTLDPDMPPIINSGTGSGFLYPYLATINNVDTLEKNASRTLKITYNLEY